jgi:DMSO/TMAO reductase YedYZ heme-binding membrane subunit
VALVAVLAHPALLLLAPKEGFGVVDLLYPVNAPRQPWINTLGAAALYLLVVVVATSIFRFEIGRKIWKPIHFSAYAAALLFFVHGFLTDPQLKDRPVDPVDAEKAFVELCFLLVLAATIVRIRYGLRRPSKRKAPRSALEPGT